jgi:hypothetical protein
MGVKVLCSSNVCMVQYIKKYLQVFFILLLFLF